MKDAAQDFPEENDLIDETAAPLPEETVQVAEEEKISQPRLLTAQNSLQGKFLEAGSSQLWNFSIQNCSSRFSVQNVKISLLTDNRDLIFEKTAWYFERVPVKGGMDLSQNVSIAKKAAAEIVPLQFQIEYEDGKGNSYSCTETVNVRISQPQRAELCGLTFPENVYASDTAIMAFQVQNTGLATIYNARVRLQGKGLFPRGELFLGNMEGGVSQPGELQVFAGTLDMDSQGNVIEGGGEKYGDTVGTVTFSYEDEQGQVFVIAGVLVCSDKFIDKDYAKGIRRYLGMTKVFQLFEEEKQEAVLQAAKAAAQKEKQQTAVRMLEGGEDFGSIMMYTRLTKEEIEEIRQNMPVIQ